MELVSKSMVQRALSYKAYKSSGLQSPDNTAQIWTLKPNKYKHFINLMLYERCMLNNNSLMMLFTEMYLSGSSLTIIAKVTEFSV